MRLVDADALKEDCRMANDCKDCKTDVRNCEYDRIYTKMDFCGWIDDAPTVDAVPVRRGRWIRHDWAEEAEGCLIPNYECSVCHAWKRDESDYCPDCGSDMRGEHEKAD